MTFSGLAAGPEDGPPLMLLHGFPETSVAWSAHLPRLAAAGYRAIAPDLRGFCDGARPAGVDAYALSLAVGDVLELASSVGATRFDVAGHDLGGIIAWELACRHPERIRTVATLSTPHLAPFARAVLDGTSERVPPFALFRQDGVAEQAMLADDGAPLRMAYQGIDPGAIEEYLRVFTAPGVLTATLSYFRAFDFDSWLALPPAPQPTLYVWGADDPFLDPDTAKATAGHVEGPYREESLQGVGHWVPELAPDQVIELLLDHLRR